MRIATRTILIAGLLLLAALVPFAVLLVAIAVVAAPLLLAIPLPAISAGFERNAFLVPAPLRGPPSR